MSVISDFLRKLRGSDNADAPTPLPSPDELVLLGRPDGEPEAQLWRDILTGEGIEALVKNVDAAALGVAGPSLQFEAWVRRKDLRRAQSALGLTDAPAS
jgi:hypothetical protein